MQVRLIYSFDMTLSYLFALMLFVIAYNGSRVLFCIFYVIGQASRKWKRFDISQNNIAQFFCGHSLWLRSRSKKNNNKNFSIKVEGGKAPSCVDRTRRGHGMSSKSSA